MPPPLPRPDAREVPPLPLAVLLGDCRVRYRGRAEARQRGGTLLALVKADGSVQLHDAKSGVKPQFYNPAGSTRAWWRADRLHVQSVSTTGEALHASGRPVFMFPLARGEPPERAPRRRVEGVERDIVDWILDDPRRVGLRGQATGREVRRVGGRYDLQFGTVVVEVKRSATVAVFDQAQRYLRQPGVRRVVVVCRRASEGLMELCRDSRRVRLVVLGDAGDHPVSPVPPRTP